MVRVFGASRWRQTRWLLIGAAVFALAHTQAPLYWSNQNQYFLHGLAQAGLGYLNQDWLANTVDPTPVFSACIGWTYRYLPDFTYYVYYALLLAVFFVSLMALAKSLPYAPRAPSSWLWLATALIAIHSAIARWGSVQLFGADYPWFLQTGLANQYVLGPGLQPSTFGILLIAAVAAFANQRLEVTVLCLAVACTLHATYLLPSALLTLGFMHVLWWEGRRRDCIVFAVATFLAVLPITIVSLRQFAPTTPEAFAEAQEILVDFRIPHHARIDRWFDWIAGAQIVWMLIGIVLVRKTRLFPVLAIAFAGAVLLSVAQLGSRTLTLLFPWRMSVVLVPVATVVILARLVALFETKVAPIGESAGPKTVGWVLIGVIAIVTVASLTIQFLGLAYRVPETEAGLFEFVRNNRQPGDVYLLPVRAPDRTLPPPRGSPSTTFVSASEFRHPTVDLQRFRFATGVPIYVDFKAIPYKDVEVLEWRRRIATTSRVDYLWFTDEAKNGAQRETLEQMGVTHFVTQPTDAYDSLDKFQCVFADEHFKVFKIRRRQ